MRKCLPYLLITVLSCFQTIASAQTGTLSGNVTDDAGKPLPFATANVLKAADSVLVAGGLSDESGRFSIKAPAAGTYILRISSIGFADASTNPFSISGNSFSRDFGNIRLSAGAKKLKDVSITSMRPAIVQKADRLVVNVEGTAMAAGSTAYEVLSKAPGVFVDQEGRIQLNGKAGVSVMIDGRLSYLSAADLRNMLESMPAENLKNIEIITNPSAKYDAQGTSGILNLNLRQNELSGMNGSVYAGYTNNFKQYGYSAGGNINYKSGKWNSFLSTDIARRVGGRNATFTRVFYAPQKTTYFDQVADGNYKVEGPPSVRFGTDYSLSGKHSIGFSAGYTTNKAESDFLTDTYIGAAANSPTQYIDADNYSSNRYTNYTGNVHYTGKLDTSGTELSTDFDYVNIRNHSISDFFNYFTTLASSAPTTTDFLYTDIPSGYNIYSAKADLVHPLGKDRKLEIGAKASRVISDNDSRFYFNNAGLVLDPNRTNHFNYRENIYAAYVNFNAPLSKKLSLQSGLRMENTQSRGELLTSNVMNKRNYLNLFPSVFLQQKVNANYEINYNYSRRLQRPNYGNLNPFISYRDPYTWIQGNPELQPEFTHSFGITQVFKQAYNLQLEYQITKDVISELPQLDVDNATTIYYTGNVDRSSSLTLTALAPLKINNKWDSQNTLILEYDKYSMPTNNGQQQNNRLFAMFQSNHTVALPWDVKMELNLGLRGPGAAGLYIIHSQAWLNAAFKKSFANKKLDLSLSATDVFKGRRLFFTTNIGTNINEFNQYFRNRAVGITLRYNFSKGQKVEKRKSSGVDELNRT